MSLIRFNRNRFPVFTDSLSDWLENKDIFRDDFFTNDRNIPAMNVKENENNFEIELAIPGFSKKEIEVTLENDVLHVSGNKSTEKIDEKDTGYTTKEFSSNSFSRTMTLPINVDNKKEVKATYIDGILKLAVQKEKEAKLQAKKVIEIK